MKNHIYVISITRNKFMNVNLIIIYLYEILNILNRLRIFNED